MRVRNASGWCTCECECGWCGPDNCEVHVGTVNKVEPVDFRRGMRYYPVVVAVYFGRAA